MRLSVAILSTAALAVQVNAIVRQYTLVITHGTIAPDGVSRTAWLVNGKSVLLAFEFATNFDNA